jgi:hypothetical protein
MNYSPLLKHDDMKAYKQRVETSYEGVSKSFRTESITKLYAYNNKHTLRSNTKGYGGKTH